MQRLKVADNAGAVATSHCATGDEHFHMHPRLRIVNGNATPFSLARPEIARRLDGSPLALLLDIDGTLAPITRAPEDAVVPDETRRILHALAGTPCVTVAAVTGRSVSDGMRMMQLDDVWMIGNHGMEVRPPHGASAGHAAAREFEPMLANAFARVRALGEPVSGVICGHKGWSLSLHYRQANRSDVAALIAGMESIGAAMGLRVLQGKEVIELRPPIDVHKGTACVALAEQVGALAIGGAVLYAGDDRTDEDAFASLRERNPDCVTIRVGAPEDLPLSTNAEFALGSTEELRDVLARILARRARL
jgi:trehalose-phosphatase